jgi:hypothetical protein
MERKWKVPLLSLVIYGTAPKNLPSQYFTERIKKITRNYNIGSLSLEMEPRTSRTHNIIANNWADIKELCVI